MKQFELSFGFDESLHSRPIALPASVASTRSQARHDNMPLIAIHYYMEDQKQWSALDLQGTSRFAGEAAAAAQPGSHAEPCLTQQRGCGDGGEQKKREEAVTSHSPRSSGEPRAGGSECNYVYNVEGESLTPKIDSFITDHICGTQAYLPEEPFTSDGLGGGGGEQKVEGRDVVIELEDDSECSCGLEHEGSRVQAALGALAHCAY